MLIWEQSGDGWVELNLIEADWDTMTTEELSIKQT